MTNPIKYVDRESGKLVAESVMGDKALKFAYNTLLGRTLWPVLFGSKLISALMGRKYDSPSSKKDIAKLISIPGCRADEAERPVESYGSFNEFFIRRLKPGARPLGEGIVSPADGRLKLYLNAGLDTPFPLKGATKSLRQVLNFSIGQSVNRSIGQFSHYDIAVFRLAPVDYHRFHFPFDCVTNEPVAVIPGKYHSVNPIALLRYPDVYADNERQVARCETNFGSAFLIDVGAFGVGTIIQTFSGLSHAKGDEKGYFKFGGSTIVMVTEAGKLKFDDDLVKNSASGLETRVKALERIAIEA